MQSDFRSGHSTITNNMKVNNDVKEALDNKATCMSLILDLTKAFDPVDHPLLQICIVVTQLLDRLQIVKHGNLLSVM